MVFMTLLRLLLLRPGLAALMASPLEEVGGKLRVNGSPAVSDSSASAKYTELFNFKLFVILLKPSSPQRVITFSFFFLLDLHGNREKKQKLQSSFVFSFSVWDQNLVTRF